MLFFRVFTHTISFVLSSNSNKLHSSTHIVCTEWLLVILLRGTSAEQMFTSVDIQHCQTSQLLQTVANAVIHIMYRWYVEGLVMQLQLFDNTEVKSWLMWKHEFTVVQWSKEA